MEIKVSVVIPCYEYGGKGVRYLSDMFRTISQQTLKEVEVIVTDQSVDTEIEDLDFKGGVLAFSGGSGAIPAYQRFDDLRFESSCMSTP